MGEWFGEPLHGRFICRIEYCPNRMLLLLYSHLGRLQFLLQSLEHFGCGRLASYLSPCVDRVVLLACQ